LGTDPWAEDRWDSEPDLADVPLPISLLDCFPREVTFQQNSPEKSVLPGVISHVDRTAFKSWEAELISPDPKLFSYAVELVITCDIRVGDFSTNASVLVDTGCRIPMLFRKGLIPKEYLEKAQKTINIVTADGTPMSGGTHGCKMEVVLPVLGQNGRRLKTVRCQALWGYESAIEGNDLILGYPFLKIFNLVVDCPSDSLKSVPFPTPFSPHTPTKRPSPTRSLTPSPKSSTNVAYPGVKLNPNPQPSLGAGDGSSTPLHSPGSKTKAARPVVNSESSSRPDFPQHRRIPGQSLLDSPVDAPATLFLHHSPPGGSLSGPPVAVPSTLPRTLGDGASTPLDTPSGTLFQCSSCLRITPIPDFDCGCMFPERTLTQMPSRQLPADIGKTAVRVFQDLQNSDRYQPPWDGPTYDLALEFPAAHSADVRGLEFSDSDWSQCHTVPVPDVVRLRTVGCPSATPIKPRILLPSDQVRNAFRSGNYRMTDLAFRKVLRVAQSQNFVPVVDAFSSSAHKRLPDYWSAHTNAFDKCWMDKILWINPSLHLLPRIVEKIFRDQAQGIILVPVRPECSWFVALQLISFFWWDFPQDSILFENPRSIPFPPSSKDTFRVVFFNAFNALDSLPSTTQPGESRIPADVPLLARVCRSLSTPDTVFVSGVIESASPHPKAAQLEQILREKFDDVMEHPIYAKDIDPRIRGPFGVCKIELKDGAKPMHKKFFRCSGEREEALNEMIKKLISRGWIVPSKSEWTSQAFVVPKPADASGKKQWRLVLDYRYLNSQTKDDPFPLPLIEDLITKQSLNRLWSIFDLEDGFHQMHLHPDSQELTAFVTPHGVYQWTVLPMGVKNGPAMFQRMIQWVLRDIPNVLVYIDDVLVGTSPVMNGKSDILDLHFADVTAVLTAFRKHKLFVKGVKMHLFRETIKFCGHILSQGQRRAAPSKLEAIKKWTPECITRLTHLKAFLGLAQYYAIYMKDFAKLAVPLSRQLKGRAPDDVKVVWDDEMREALEKIKALLLENVVLDIPDPYKPYVLEVDSSDYAVGGVLSQQNDVGELRPVAFFSRKLQGDEGKGQAKWSIREKETYAIVLILQKFRSWVASSLIRIMVQTDHQSLQHWYTEDLNKATSSVGRRCRWHEFLSQFNLIVVYVPGHTQKVADPLSRAPWHQDSSGAGTPTKPTAAFSGEQSVKASKFTVWRYPGNPDEGDETFHGSREADVYAKRCEEADNLLDNFPVSRLFVDNISAALRGRRRRGRASGPRRITRSETPFPLFFREWDYSADHTFGPVWNRLKNGEQVENFSLTPQRLVFRHSGGSKYCVPRDILRQVLECYHTHGHPGAPKLLSLVKRRHHFSVTDKELLDECVFICQHCQICQAVKQRHGKAPGSLDFFPVPEDIFSSLCMDFLELEPCKGTDGKEYNYVLVIVCRLSGYILAIPCQKAGLTAISLAQLFLEKCVCFMGLPNEIVSDQDHLISSKFFSTLCGLVGIEQHFAIIYRPKGNGRAEAAVKAVVNILRLALTEHKSTWLQALPWALFQQNSLPGIVLPHSPHKIVFGREPPELGDIPSSRPQRISVSCEEWFAQIDKFRKDVQSRVIKTHDRVRQNFLKDFRVPIFEPGDKVWVRNSANRTDSTKLDPLWTGPCEILERVGNSGRYKVSLPSGVEDFHMDCFKPYLSAPDGKAIPCHYFKPRPKLPESDDFVVQKILAHKIDRGVHYWKVRWKGYGPEEDSWEPASSFVGYIQQDWKLWNKNHGISFPVTDL